MLSQIFLTEKTINCGSFFHKTFIGAGAGTGVVLATSGDEVEFPNEQRMVFKLTHSVTIPVE